MARRISLSQIRSQLRQAQSKQKQAVDRFNREVRAHNQKRKHVVDDYNCAIRNHNAKVRTNQQKLQQELRKLQNASRTRTLRVTVSAQRVHTAFTVLEQRHQAGTVYPEDLYSLFQNETANSLRTANAIEGNGVAEPNEIEALQATTLDGELEAFAPELAGRWKGALFSLNPKNPDAARHFCTSVRECFVTALDVAAPDQVVERELSSCKRTEAGRLTRRSKLKYLLVRKGVVDDAVEDFVNEDVEDILGLFRVFNDGTHGTAGRFDLNELVAVKQRAESGIRFLYHLAQ
jgi:hypothetical protein